MARTYKTTQRSQLLLVLTLLFGVFFNYPILSIFNKEVFWGNIPTLHGFLYASWILLIIILFWVSRRLSKNS